MNSDNQEKIEPLWQAPMGRRDFLDWIIKGGLLVTLTAMLAPALAYLWPVVGRGPVGGLKEVARIDEVPIGGAKKVILNGSPVLIIRTAQEWKAFSAICTHLGCVVGWDERQKQIVCPCHAGLFDLQGKVIGGPPPRPLTAYSVVISENKILVKV